MDNYTITSTDVPKTYTQEQYDYVMGLANDAERRYQSIADSYRRLDTKVNSVKDILVRKMQDEEIDSDVAREIADALDLTLNKTYDVTITVRFSGVVEVPFDFDIDTLQDHLSASLDSDYSSDVELDVSEDEMYIDAHESYY